MVLILAAIFGFIIAKDVTQQYANEHRDSNRNAELDRVLSKAASHLNKNSPMMLSKDLRQDGAIGFDHKFKYKLTFVNYTASEIDASKLQAKNF